MTTADRQVMPWEEDQVFSFPDRKDWVFWIAGLDKTGVSEVAATVPGGAGNPAVLGAIEAQDKDALSEEHVWWGVGLWFPEDQGHTPCAGALVRTYNDRGDYRKAFKKAVKQSRKPPVIPDTTITGYTSGPGDIDLGPIVEQTIDTVDATGAVHMRTRISIFPPAKDEVVQIEFQTVDAHLVDRLTDEGGDLISRAYYQVSSEWLAEHAETEEERAWRLGRVSLGLNHDGRP